MTTTTWKPGFRSLALVTVFIMAIVISVIAPAHSVYAATITISDQDSCENAGGDWGILGGQECTFQEHFIVNTGNVLQTSVPVYFDEGLTNNGTIHFGEFALTVGLSNNGTINTTDNFRLFRGVNTNSGTINVNYGGALLISSSLTNTSTGTININNGGYLYNHGTLNNQGTINRNCGGTITGDGSYQGNPPVATACPTNTPVPPTNTPVPPTNTPVPPTNTPVPPTFTPTVTNTPLPGCVPSKGQPSKCTPVPTKTPKK